MYKVVFIIVLFSSFPTFGQELGISVEQFLNIKKDAIERTSDNDRLINRQYFVFNRHPNDPTGLLYIQNYEEEYFFYKNRLYFIVKEYRALENRWKYDLAGFMNKYSRYPERSSTTPDGSWFINKITFYNDMEEYEISIFRPSQRWNTVFMFADGEALVRVEGKHRQYLGEYQSETGAFR
jgi:hypothetical protein